MAGGASRRFNGLIKTKIVVDGRTILSRLIDVLEDIFDEIIIVTNTPEEFKEYTKYNIIGDQFLNKGPLGGIHAALNETDKEAIFVIAGDMPFPDKEIILNEIDFYSNNNGDIIIPRINKFIEPLHGIYKKTILRMMEEYLEAGNDCAIREFIKKSDVRFFEPGESDKSKKAFTNINSPADLVSLRG
jgi:molybdopterin-guanine dinucleotide biosynthesis protein A